MRNLSVINGINGSTVPLDIVLLAGPNTPLATYSDICNELKLVIEKHFLALEKQALNAL